jgi:hypothetical protein
VSIVFIILLATLTNAANVLNSSSSNSKGFPAIANTTAKPVIANTTAKPVIANTTAKPVIANTTAKPVIANTTAKPNEKNKTGIAALPSATTTRLTADNKTIISNISESARSSSGMSNFNRLTNATNVPNSSSINSNGFPVNTTSKLAIANERNKTNIAALPSATTTTGTDFGNPYPSGMTFPISIHGGKLVGILADENMATMILVLDPRNMTIELPRIVIVP